MSIKQEKPPTFCCRWKGCRNLFYTSSRLIAHTGEHLVNETTCYWKNCQSKGPGLNILGLSEHVVAHCKQQRPYKCPNCEESLFISAETLQHHLDKIHVDNDGQKGNSRKSVDAVDFEDSLEKLSLSKRAIMLLKELAHKMLNSDKRLVSIAFEKRVNPINSGVRMLMIVSDEDQSDDLPDNYDEYENVLLTVKPTVYLGVLPNDSFNLLKDEKWYIIDIDEN